MGTAVYPTFLLNPLSNPLLDGGTLSSGLVCVNVSDKGERDLQGPKVWGPTARREQVGVQLLDTAGVSDQILERPTACVSVPSEAFNVVSRRGERGPGC